eukprot:CAMPEP_0117574796 /NCGR_PEP_ID=MMETSP0784-20121206/61817_1 /TAXON_ID=39447 /ORGANISM="" /LENGTH=47 /DNA_ID= /DNA_START= /DNA_END= /DNA_ORIENTATION=
MARAARPRGAMGRSSTLVRKPLCMTKPCMAQRSARTRRNPLCGAISA